MEMKLNIDLHVRLKKMISDLIQQIFQSLEDESGKKSARDSALCDVIFHHVQNVAQFANTVNCLDFWATERYILYQL